MGPRVNIIIIPITRPIIAAVRDCAGVMLIINAEKTPTASLIPRPPGVIEIKITKLPIQERNKAWKKGILIPIIL